MSLLARKNWSLWALVFLIFSMRNGLASDVGDISFANQIRSILSDKCFACHGPDKSKRKANLRLDTKEGMLASGKSGFKAVIPGNVLKSELHARIVSTDADLVMPPPENGKFLTDEEKQLIEKWIAQGAQWEEHWAFVKPKKTKLPKIDSVDSAMAKNPIDLFVLSKLEEKGMGMNPPANKSDLLRRLTFDLIGLPPTLEQVEDYIHDKSDDAYVKAVDRILRSENFGEHMARYWLDAARYGDTHGLHLDNYREMWPYRDWVIEAFNSNIPYDQFVKDQLAGDLYQKPTTNQMVATGFNRCHVTTGEGGSIKEEVFIRNVVERVVATGTVFMGLTLDCSRCHDHKFDPITMQDFYSLSAYFNSLDGNPLDGNRKDHAPVMKVPTRYQEQKIIGLKSKLSSIEKVLKSDWLEVDALQEGWANSLQQKKEEELDTPVLYAWSTVGPFHETRENLTTKNQGPEGRRVDLKDVFMPGGGIILDWKVRSDWKDGKVISDLSGDYAANYLFRTINVKEPQKLTVSLGSDDGIKVYLNMKLILDKDVSRGVAADQEKLILDLQKGNNNLLIKIMNYGGATGFYFKMKPNEPEHPEEVLKIVMRSSNERSMSENKKLRDYFRNKISDYPELLEKLAEAKELKSQINEVESQIPISLVWKEKKEPVDAYILKRGSYQDRGEKVLRQTPKVLPKLNPDYPNNRLGLAMWLTDQEHPLTARVAVNRIWQQIFGTGLVKTSEDFGTQGEFPSHPELLDWLAVDFRESGWNVKRLLKMIVTSSTYTQSSRFNPSYNVKDPENRYFHRGPRFRLDAEMIRDQALHISGLLNLKVGGAPVKPPQPDGLWFAVGYSGSNTVQFKADIDPEKTHRRSIYTFHKRTSPPPQMNIFDGPSREACVMRRERTNTPMQALLLLNDPQFIEAAIGFAQRGMDRGFDQPRDICRWMFSNALLRSPTELELNLLVKCYNEEKGAFDKAIDRAQNLLSVGNFTGRKFDKPAEMAALTMVSNLILNTDEILNKN